MAGSRIPLAVADRAHGSRPSERRAPAVARGACGAFSFRAMAQRALAVLGSFVSVAVATQKHWAVLVAGSKDWWNYRHQADVCHAYHVLIERRFHPERIITMLYDDVATSRMNPFPGKLFNFPWPCLEEAVDVRAGCQVDYSGAQVTSETFLAVLRGDAAAAGGKVLASGADDHVFVNFVDHGDVGIIAFPQDEDVLHAKKLVETLVDMHRRGMYQQLAFYLETCNSGSIFQGLLPDDLPVYAVAAASANESSWAAFCGSASRVAGRPLDTCLGDLFSVNWMTDSDFQRRTNETMDQQFQAARAWTNKSHVERFGDVPDVGPELVSDFLGVRGEAAACSQALRATEALRATAAASAMSSRDVRLEHLRRRSDEAARRELRRELDARAESAALSAALATAVLGRAPLDARLPGDFAWTPAMADCHELAVGAFGAACGWAESRLRLAATLYALCEATAADVGPLLLAVHRACARPRAEVFA